MDLNRIWILCFVCCLSSTSASTPVGDVGKYLLPGNVVPVHYDLAISTHLDKFDEKNEESYTFDGSVSIRMVAVEDGVKSVVIHKYTTVNVTKAVLYVKGNSPVDLGPGSFDRSRHKLTFELKNPLVKKESVVLYMEFTGRHEKFQRGFYRLAYKEDGVKKMALVTQLQPTYARYIFPCFDEPRYKATFNISVGVPAKSVESGFKALANTGLDHIEKTKDEHIFHFRRTPLPISSYLLALAVNQFASTPAIRFNSTYLNSPNRNPKELRTWGRESLIKKGRLAQVPAAALLDIYTRDYKIGYGYDKLDQVAQVHYSGGMENWGLIIYEEGIIDPPVTDVDGVTLIAHELGHQWFGNLVTCHWWSDLWLNEGFATYVEFFGAAKIKTPDLDMSPWKLREVFVIEIQQSIAFENDLPGITHPLTVEVYQPEMIEDIFDAIEYEKGAAVLRMWSHILGLDTFNQGLQNYLMKYREGLSTPHGLLTSFDGVANRSVSTLPDLPSKIFKCWINQEGYPLVHARRNGESPLELLVTQEPFRLRDNAAAPTTKWNIPITYSNNTHLNFNDTRANLWLMSTTKSLVIPIQMDIMWIVVNNQQSGYYRVNYDPQNWKALLNILMDPKTATLIHEINRAQIIDDVANIARSIAFDYVSYEFFMDLTLYLRHERDLFPWKAALRNFDYLNRMLSKDQVAHSLFKKHILSITSELYDAYTTLNAAEDVSTLERQLRAEILSWTCRMGQRDCIDVSRRILHDHLNNNVSLPRYLAVPTYCSAMRDDDNSLWKRLWELYLNSESVHQRKILISGITCTGNVEILTMLLNRVLDRDEEVRNDEREMIMTAVYNGNPENAALLLDFVSNNYESLYEVFGETKTISDMLKLISRGLGTDEELTKINRLINSIRESTTPGVSLTERSASTILEIAETNNEWLRVRKSAIADWLLSRYGPSHRS